MGVSFFPLFNRAEEMRRAQTEPRAEAVADDDQFLEYSRFAGALEEGLGPRNCAANIRI